MNELVSESSVMLIWRSGLRFPLVIVGISVMIVLLSR
jgi:hypothetical protein